MVLQQNVDRKEGDTIMGILADFDRKEIKFPRRHPPSWAGLAVDGWAEVLVEFAPVAEPVSTLPLSSDPSVVPPPLHF